MVREGLLEDMILGKTGRMRINHLTYELKEEHFRQRKQQVQRFRGWKEPGMFQEQKGTNAAEAQ